VVPQSSVKKTWGVSDVSRNAPLRKSEHCRNFESKHESFGKQWLQNPLQIRPPLSNKRRSFSKGLIPKARILRTPVARNATQHNRAASASEDPMTVLFWKLIPGNTKYFFAPNDHNFA